MNYYRKLSISFALSISLLLLFFQSSFHYKEPRFPNSYQSVLQKQYDLLRAKKKKDRILLVGGSNLAFGVDTEYMNKNLKEYEVLNLGLHAGMGYRYLLDLVSEHAREGDKVILALEYGWQNKGGMEKVGADLLLSGIDHRQDIYRDLSFQTKLKLFPEVLDFNWRKLRYQKPQKGKLYQASVFDERANLRYPRKKTVIEDKNLVNAMIKKRPSEESLKILKEFKQLMEKQGVDVYFSYPSIHREAVVLDKGFDEKDFQDYILEKTGIPFISQLNDYLFSYEKLYDTIYHLNDKGVKIRSRQLVKDIQNNVH